MASNRKGFQKSALWLGLLTAFTLFHGVMITIAPNRQTPLGNWIKPVIEPYLNAFEFGALWNFFSPDPGTPVYLEWEIFDTDRKLLGHGMMPDFQNQYFLRERYNRRMVSARFLAENDKRVSAVLGRYVCNQNPEAFSIQFWMSVFPLPGREDVRRGKKRLGDIEALDRHSTVYHVCDRGHSRD